MPVEANEIKVILLGGAKTGKSSISLRFTKNKFLPYPIVAPGTSTLSKSVALASSSNSNNNVNVHIKIWDTSGNRSLLPIYYKRADAAILVYDICNQDSFITLQSWVTELQNNAPSNISITVCGNKNDMSNRVVDSTAARIYTEQFGGYYIETSAKTNVSIQQLFIDTVRRTNIFKKIRPFEAPRMISSKVTNNSRPMPILKKSIKKQHPMNKKASKNHSSMSSSLSSSIPQNKRRKFDHEDSEIITTKKCSYCLASNAAVIVGAIAEKPLCLLHYHTTRAIRTITGTSKVKQIGNNGFVLQQQLPNVQELFAEAYVELQKEIEEENARIFLIGGSNRSGTGLKKKAVMTRTNDLLGDMLGNNGKKKKTHKTVIY